MNPSTFEGELVARMMALAIAAGRDGAAHIDVDVTGPDGIRGITVAVIDTATWQRVVVPSLATVGVTPTDVGRGGV